MARKLAAIAFSLGCLHAGSVLALGLGDVRLESFLNEPLRASVDLLNMGGLHEDEIKIRLATTEDFDKLGIERNYFLTSITFNVVADGHGGARIEISSEEPVLEPYLDFIVEARWPSGRLIREYTVLVDPQVFSQATPVVSASQRVE
jgi:pilus assembly protein FimV